MPSGRSLMGGYFDRRRREQTPLLQPQEQQVYYSEDHHQQQQQQQSPPQPQDGDIAGIAGVGGGTTTNTNNRRRRRGGGGGGGLRGLFSHHSMSPSAAAAAPAGPPRISSSWSYGARRKQQQQQQQHHHQQQRKFDTRRIRVPKESAAAAIAIRPSQSNASSNSSGGGSAGGNLRPTGAAPRPISSSNPQQSNQRQQQNHASNYNNVPVSAMTTPRGVRGGGGVLPENRKDSTKKERTFPVRPVRRIQHRPDAQDPPEQRSSIRHPRGLGGRGTAAGEEEKKQSDEEEEPMAFEVELDDHDDDGDYGESDYFDVDDEEVEVTVSTVQHLSPISSSVLRQDQSQDVDDDFSRSFFSPQSRGGGGGGATSRTTMSAGDESTTFRSLPPSPYKPSGRQQQPQVPSTPQHHSTLKQVLSRPFGRQSLPPSVARRIVAEVGDPEWDPRIKQYKYRILVQRRQLQSEDNNTKDHLQPQTLSAIPSGKSTSAGVGESSTTHSSFTTAYTWRTLADVEWLAASLNSEFHGALVLPTISLEAMMANGNKAGGNSSSPNGGGINRPVPAAPVRDWLNDVLNGIRGQGEWLLETPNLLNGILQSESMETFLYKSGLPAGNNGNSANDNEANSTVRDDDDYSSSIHNPATSLLHSLWSKPLELCVGPEPDWVRNGYNRKQQRRTQQQQQQQQTPSPSDQSKRNGNNNSTFCTPTGHTTSLSMELLASCSASRAQLFTENASVVDDSTIGSYDPLPVPAVPQHLSTPSAAGTISSVTAGPPTTQRYPPSASQLVQAEAELALNYHQTCIVVLSKLQVLQQEEEFIAQYWNRFAKAVITLFSYEKGVENQKLMGSTIKKENMPYRKVAKTRIDESVMLMAVTKSDRAVPALTILDDMLEAYAADLHSVGSAVEAYKQGAAEAFDVDELMEDDDLYDVTTDDDGDDDDSDPNRNNNGGGWARNGSWEDRIKKLATNGMRSARQRLEEKRRRDMDRRQRVQERLQTNEQLLRHSLTSLCRSTSIRVARMAWRHWNTEASKCSAINAAAISLKAKVDVVSKESVAKLSKRHAQEQKEDNATELDLITRIVNIHKSKKINDGSSVISAGGDDTQVEVDSDAFSEERSKATKRGKALDIAGERIGRWNSMLSLAIMEAVEVENPSIPVEETTRELRLVRKYAIGLRENVNRCIDAIQMLRAVYSATGRPDPRGRATKGIFENRREFLKELAKLFSGKLVVDGSVPKRSSPSMAVLARAGVDTSDPFGWGMAVKDIHHEPSTPESARSSRQGRVGELAVAYLRARDAHTNLLLKSIHDLLTDYVDRVEEIEGFVYMECVGIQLERHFSQRRAKALSAFEKKTDITSAINVATRKRLTKLVKELHSKLEQLGPEVSHTLVKETKEMHLESKNLKAELHELALRRLTRARETSTQRVVDIMSLWAKEEENAATSELKALGEAMAVLERSVGNVPIDSLVHRVSQEIKSTPGTARSKK